MTSRRGTHRVTGGRVHPRPDSPGSHRSVPGRPGTHRGLAAVGLLAGVLIASTVGWLPGSADRPAAGAKTITSVQAVPNSDTGPIPAPPQEPPPAFVAGLPAETTQVVRTIRTNEWCAKVYCTKTEAWERAAQGWRIAAKADGSPAVFRSTIGPKGFAAPGMRREDDDKSPSGVYAITVTFSTTKTAPGPMPWRRRLPTSVVSGEHGKNYNTWVESKGLANGDRPSMRFGFWMDYNNPRLTPGVGAKPVPGVGSGIFYHTSWPGQEWVPTIGCVALGNPADMAWVVAWLDPAATPRVVGNI